MSDSAIGDDRNAVHVGAGERFNFKFELQSDFIVGMKIGSGFHLDANVFVLRAGIGLLGNGARASDEGGGIDDQSDLSRRH